MAQYNYDDTGAIFSYFLCALFSLVLIPYTFSALFRKEKTQYSDCKCSKCLKNNEFKRKISKKGYFNILLLLCGWITFGFVCYQAVTLHEKEQTLWDPYHILGVDPDADESVIRKAFKKLSLKYHPDKVKAEEKEEAEKQFIEISKAHKVLTDEEARKLFEEFGHPDGKQAFQLGLALPKWLIEESNSSIVLLFYTLAFGIGLPYMVAQWWRSAKVTAKNKVLNETMANFYRELNDDIFFKNLVIVMCKALEYQDLENYCEDDTTFKPYEKRVIDEVARVGARFDFKVIKKRLDINEISYRTLVLITAHFLRLSPESELLQFNQTQAVHIATRLVSGMIQICVSRNWLKATNNVLQLSQLLSQAMLPHQSPLLQLPNVSNEILKTVATKKTKVSNIIDILKLSEDNRRELFGALNDEEYDQLVKVANDYPRINIAKAEYAVAGENAIVPSSLVTLSIKFQCHFGGSELPKLNDSLPEIDHYQDKAKNMWWKDKVLDNTIVHSYLPIDKRAGWNVYLANTRINRLICMQKTIGLKSEHLVRLQFQSPPEPGSWTFTVFITSDVFVGADKQIELTLNVQPASVLPPVVEETIESSEDEFEDDEQVEEKEKPKRKVLPKSDRGEFDDSSDSSDGEESIGADEDFVE